MTPPHRVARIALMFALGALILAPVALAGKGGHGGSGGTTSGGGTISLALINSSDGLAHFGASTTFNVSTSNPYPWVNLRCSVGGVVVLNMLHGFFPAYQYGQTFWLGPTDLWQSGPADCTASVVVYSSNGRSSTIGSTSFHVYA